MKPKLYKKLRVFVLSCLRVEHTHESAIYKELYFKLNNKNL